MTENKTPITISIDAEHQAIIEEIQSMVPMSKSELIRKALDAYLPEYNKLSEALKRAGLENKQ